MCYSEPQCWPRDGAWLPSLGSGPPSRKEKHTGEPTQGPDGNEHSCYLEGAEAITIKGQEQTGIDICA